MSKGQSPKFKWMSNDRWGRLIVGVVELSTDLKGNYLIIGPNWEFWHLSIGILFDVWVGPRNLGDLALGRDQNSGNSSQTKSWLQGKLRLYNWTLKTVPWYSHRGAEKMKRRKLDRDKVEVELLFSTMNRARGNPDMGAIFMEGVDFFSSPIYHTAGIQSPGIRYYCPHEHGLSSSR